LDGFTLEHCNGIAPVLAELFTTFHTIHYRRLV
jgi:hypothetical protein